MSAPTLDWTRLQNLLASAFVVQESRLDPEAVSAFLDVQRSVRSKRPATHEALAWIAQRAANIARADGVAIALLEQDQFIYRAGTGINAHCLGAPVGTALFFSGHRRVTNEAVIIDNALGDLRGETAICRQFETQSLVLLPFYQGENLGGVLQVVFREPHVFQAQEVSAYRLLGALIEETLTLCSKSEIAPAPEKRETATVEAVADIPPAPTVKAASLLQPEALQPAIHFESLPVTPAPARPSWMKQFRMRTAVTSQRLLVLGRKLEIKVKIEMPGTSLLLRTLRRAAPVGLVLGMLGGVSWLDWQLSTVAYGSSPRPQTPAASAASMLPAFTSASESAPETAAMTKAADPGGAPAPRVRTRVRARSGASSHSGFRPVRVGPNETDYVSRDVTMRVFNSQSNHPVASTHPLLGDGQSSSTAPQSEGPTPRSK